MSTSCPMEISASHAAAAPREGAYSIRSNRHAPQSKRASNCAIFAMLLTALQRGPKTRLELIETVGVSPNAVYRFITALHDQGAIYIQRRRHNGSKGKPTDVFALNPTPFAFVDAVTITVQ